MLDAGASGARKETIMTEFKQAPVVGSKRVDAGAPGTKAKVYFTRSIDAEHLIKLYNLVNENIYGKVAIKLHTGEKHGPNILPRDMVQAFRLRFPTALSWKRTRCIRVTVTLRKIIGTR